MYQQDSFFDLTPSGRVGLVSLSTVLCITVLCLTVLVLRRRALWLQMLGGLVAFWLFVWVSPQVYYQYYRMIIIDLPLQWVIWPPASPREAFNLLFFQGPHNLSDHSQGLLGWSLLAAPLLRRYRAHRKDKP